jgi:hypothetical protein
MGVEMTINTHSCKMILAVRNTNMKKWLRKSFDRGIGPYPKLHTPRSRVLPEKLICPQLVKKFPAFYGTRRFITAFTSARHLSLS